MQEIAARLNALCDDEPYVTGWYLKDLKTGATADRNGEMVFPSASTRKISIMMAALAAVHAGTLSLDAPFEIEKKYQDNNSGVFQFLSTGITITFRDAITMMIIVSDNACTGKIVDIVGLDAVNAYTRRVGMAGSTHRFNIPPKVGRDHTLEQANTTTPADVGRLLELILQGTTDESVAARLGVTTELCKLALDILLWQRHDQPAAEPAANRGPGGSQDRHRRPGSQQQRRRHHLPGRYPSVHPVRLHREPAGQHAERHVRVPARRPDDRQDGEGRLRRLRRPRQDRRGWLRPPPSDPERRNPPPQPHPTYHVAPVSPRPRARGRAGRWSSW